MDALNVLYGMIALDVHAGIERDFEVLTRWGESIDRPNL